MSLHSYLSGRAAEGPQRSMLACFLVYHAVPTPGQLAAGGLEGEPGGLSSELRDSVRLLGKLFPPFIFFNCLGSGCEK